MKQSIPFRAERLSRVGTLSPLNIGLESIAVVMLLIPSFFRVFLPGANVVTLGLTILALLLLLAFASRAYDMEVGSSSRCIIILAVFFCLVLVNANADLAAGSGYLWMVQFGGALIAIGLLLAGGSSRWVGTAFRVIGLFGLFYSVATIVFWIVPDLYSAVYPYLQSRSEATIAGMGYRAGLTTHYSTNGMYTVLGFLACSSIALSRKSRCWTVCACLCLFALVLTTKRAHLAFGVVAFTIAYFMLNSRRKLGTFGKLIAAASIALIILYIFSFFNDDILAVLERFQSMEDDDSFGGRSGFYDLCLSMWSESPLVGNGWGSYTLAFNKTAEGAWYVGNGFNSMDAHNVYLQILAEEGLAGFFLLVGAIGVGLVKTLRALLFLNAADEKGGRWRGVRCLLAGSFSIQLFFAMYCLTGNPLYDAQMYIPWLISLGAAATLSRDVERCGFETRKKV